MATLRGLNLRDLRRKAGLTQDQLAERIDLKRAMVSHLETGKRQGSPELWEKWIEACGYRLLMYHEADSHVPLRVGPAVAELATRIDEMPEDERRTLLDFVASLDLMTAQERRQILRIVARAAHDAMERAASSGAASGADGG